MAGRRWVAPLGQRLAIVPTGEASTRSGEHRFVLSAERDQYGVFAFMSRHHVEDESLGITKEANPAMQIVWQLAKADLTLGQRQPNSSTSPVPGGSRRHEPPQRSRHPI